MIKITKASEELRKKFRSIQKKLDKLPLVRLDIRTSAITKNTHCMTVRDFVEYFLGHYNGICSTLYIKDDTVYEPKGKLRTAHDIYRITKYYFAQVTYEEIQEALAEIAAMGELTGSFCPDIGKDGEHVYSVWIVHATGTLQDMDISDGKYKELGLYNEIIDLDELLELYEEKGKSVDNFFN